MATLRKPTYSKPIPPDATIITKGTLVLLTIGTLALLAYAWRRRHKA